MKPIEYRIGDTFKGGPEGTSDRVRLRIREITQLDHWDEQMYTLQLYTCSRFYPENPAASTWGWMNRDHDRHFTSDDLEEFGWFLVSRGKRPAPVQMDLFQAIA